MDVRPDLPRARRRRDRARGKPPARPRAVRFFVPTGETAFDDLVHGRIEFDSREHRRLRPPSLRRPSDLPPLGRRGRRRDGDHARGARRRSHLEHAEADPDLPRARRRGAGVRARAADSRARQEAAEQAARRDVGRRIRAARAICRRPWSISWRCSAGRPASDEEVFTRDELVARFSLEGISGGNAVFNPGEARLVQSAAHPAVPAAEILSTASGDRSRRRDSGRTRSNADRRGVA